MNGLSLTGADYNLVNGGNVQNCIAYCKGFNFLYAGLQYG